MNTPYDSLVTTIEKAASIEAFKLTRTLRQSPSETPEFAAQVRAAVIKALNTSMPSGVDVEAAIFKTAKSASTDIYRRHTSKKRNIRKQCSLDAPARGENQTLAEVLEKKQRPEGVSQTSHVSDLRMDVDTILAALPSHLREICTRLQRESIAEVAQSMGYHSKTIYSRLEQARMILDQKGFKNFSK